MKKISSSLVFLFLLTCCGTDELVYLKPTVNLTEGLVVNILFDSTLIETISGTVGTNKRGEFFTNRLGVAKTAIHFKRTDSAQVNFGDLEGASFTDGLFSASCWVLLEDSVLPCAAFSKRSATGGFEYSLDNHFRNKQYFNFDNWIENGSNTVYGIDPLNASAAIQLNKWQHLVYAADGSNLRVYLNGALQTGVDLKTSGQVFSNTNMPFVVGNGGGYGKNYYFQGAIDDIKLYNRVLNNDEVKALYAQ